MVKVSGRQICRELVELNVAAQKVVWKQDTGDYVADFFVPEMQEATKPAAEWAKLIKKALPTARIMDTHDTKAVWRPGKPVIYATVIFRLPELEDFDDE